MDARLVVIGGKTNRSEIKLKLPSVFGRGRDADITIAHAAVSRQHCRIEEVDGALVLRDSGSTNGTFFGKQRIKEMVIRPGDLFSIGPLTFRAEYEHSGSFPAIGDPRPEYHGDATIQFTPGDELSEPTPPDGTPVSGKAAAAKHAAPPEPVEELDFFSSDPTEAGLAKADLGVDFLSEPEPAAAAPAEPKAAAAKPAAAEPADDFDLFSADEAQPAHAKADSGVDFLSEPEPATPAPTESKAAAAKPAAAEPADDFDLFSADEAKPADAKADSGVDFLSEPEPATPAPAESKAAPAKPAAAEPADDFDLFSADEAEPADAKADSGVDFLSEPEPRPAPAADEAGEREAAAASDSDDFMAAFQEDDPIGASLSEPAEEAGDDPLLDMGFDEPAVAAEQPKTPAAQPEPVLNDRDGSEPDLTVNFMSSEADGDGEGDDELTFDLHADMDAGDAGDQDEDTAELLAAPAAKHPPAAPIADDEPHFELPGENGAEAEFDPFADDEAPVPAASANGLADLGESDPDGSGLDDIDEGMPAPALRGGSEQAKESKSGGSQAPAGKGKAAKGHDAKKGWWPFGKGPAKAGRKSAEPKDPGERKKPSEPQEPAQPAAAKMPEPETAAVMDDDELPDFFEDAAEPPAAPTKPAAAKPAAAIDDELPDFFEDVAEPPPAPTKSAAAKAEHAQPGASKPAASKPGASKPAASKPAASKPAAAKPAADEPDLDFLGSGSAAAEKPTEDDDGLDDFFQDLGLN